jgi:hypothetical protein
VAIRLKKPLAPGREFVLFLAGAASATTPLRYRVVRCRPLGQGNFHMGASFVRIPTASQPRH